MNQKLATKKAGLCGHNILDNQVLRPYFGHQSIVKRLSKDCQETSINQYGMEIYKGSSGMDVGMRSRSKLRLRDNTARKLASLARVCKGRSIAIAGQIAVKRKLRMSERDIDQFLNYMRRKSLVSVTDGGQYQLHPSIPDRPSSARFLCLAERLLADRDYLTTSELCSLAEESGIVEPRLILQSAISHDFLEVDASQGLVVAMASKYEELRNYLRFLARRPRAGHGRNGS